MRLIDADALARVLIDIWLSKTPNDNDTLEIKSYKESVCEGIEMAMDTVEGLPTIGGWISVKDRMPERYERILTYDKYNDAKENQLLQLYPSVSWLHEVHVTHWMPLPEPPKGK